MVDYEKLCSLDYTVYDQARHFEDIMDKAGISNPAITMDYSYSDEYPVVELTAIDIRRNAYAINAYEMTNVNEEEFEVVMHDIWIDCLKNIADSLDYRSLDTEKQASKL